MGDRITLGDKVKDKLTGLEGVAAQRIENLYGSPRIGVQRGGVDSDNHAHRIDYIDESQLDVVES